MWKARAQARTEVCSQECQVQGMPLNRTLPQGMSIQEKRQESTSCPDSTTSEQTGHSHQLEWSQATQPTNGKYA